MERVWKAYNTFGSFIFNQSIVRTMKKGVIIILLIISSAMAYAQEEDMTAIAEAEHNEQIEKEATALAEQQAELEHQQAEAMRAQAEAARAIAESVAAKCMEDLESCSCEEIPDQQARGSCETARQQAITEADAEKRRIIQECTADLQACNCDQIKYENDKASCEAEKEKAAMLKEKIKSSCEKDLGACSCAEIENEEGRAQCESAREQAIEQAGEQVNDALNKCFRDVDACDCKNLGLPKQEYIDFCEVEKSYGISCRDEGLYCEELESMPLVPPGLPSFLAPIFQTTYKQLIEKEKEKGASQAAEMMRQCILKPEECDCSKAPTYAVKFCEEKKQLQIRCLSDDYDACMLLEQSPDLPEGMPAFSVGLFQKIAAAARKIQEGIAKTRAVKKVGDMILECMDDENKCDCTLAPQGRWRSFCQHKKELVTKCRAKNYGACFTLDEEPIITEDMPEFIKSYINKHTVPKIEEKKQTIYDRMKTGTICENIATLDECRTAYYGS